MQQRWTSLVSCRLQNAAIALVCLLHGSLPAAEPASPDFERDVQPIFTAHCVKCHGSKAPKGGLRLIDARAITDGGDSGPAIVPSKPAASHLIERIASTDDSVRMPPEGERLSAAEIAVLKAWIAAGAKWPEKPGAEAAKNVHWSLRPVVRPPVPGDTSQAAHPIDPFIADRLAANQLTLSLPADRRTLIRRLSFDLVGLPPTPEEVDRFVTDPDPLAYERLVDRLLASPAYGERWAQHWLDVVRFAESDGFETNKPRANAWPYRDYVIAALNADKPFDRFVLEQLAGDALGEDAATGFLVGGANDVVKSPDPVLTAQQRADVLHDMVSTTGTAFLGLTVGCARCHNHKFDPILQTDYYAMTASLAGVEHGERQRAAPDQAERDREFAHVSQRLAAIDGEILQFEPLASPVLAEGSQPLRPAVHPRLNVERFPPRTIRRLRFTVHKTSNLEPCIDELEVLSTSQPPANVALASLGVKARASSVYPNSTIHRLEHINDGQLGNGRSWISAEMGLGWVELEFPQPVEVFAVRWGRDREERYQDRLPLEYTITVAASEDDWQVVAGSSDRRAYEPGKPPLPGVDAASLAERDRAVAEKLLAERSELASKAAALSMKPMLYAGLFTAQPPETKRFQRGDPTQPRETVPPGTLQVVAVSTTASIGLPSLTDDQARRMRLAKWIAHRDHPLTARVIANRLWQHHFGIGLVATPSDFGANGAAPSHPELLDWLAAELVDHGWRLKHMHRLIVTSATYRQASAPRAEGIAVDAQSRLLWRYPPRRLEAEPLRDAVLAASGVLDSRMGGPGFLAFEPNDNYVRVYRPKQAFGPADWRRMVYMTKIRMQQDATFGAFDCPDGGQIAPQRASSITPLQALNLLNGPFLVQQADLLADRCRREAGDDVAEQARHVFRLTLQREPATEEFAAAVAAAREHGLSALCRALFNSNEFLYLD